MTNYGRVPNLELSVEEKKEEKEEEVFVEPVDDKKQKLKDHLAKCREKSMAVRKAKKEEKLANKKPVGRPSTKTKPKKEEEIPTTYQPAPEYVSSEEEEEEEEVFIEKPKPKPKAVKKPQSYKNVATSETMDYDRLADMVASKLRPPTPAPTYHEPTSNNFGFGNYEQMRAYENKIRDEERNKYQLEHNTKQQEKAKRLDQATKQYFRKMPSVNFHKEPSNMWDDAFNPRR